MEFPKRSDLKESIPMPNSLLAGVRERIPYLNLLSRKKYEK